MFVEEFFGTRFWNAVSSYKYVRVLPPKNTAQQIHLVLPLTAYCVIAYGISFRSSAYTDERESSSPKRLPSEILHQERENKVFGKCSTQLLNRFLVIFNFVTMAHLPPRRACVSHHWQQRVDAKHRCRLLYPITTKEQMYNHLPSIMSFIVFNLIYLDMVLLLQVLILIGMIHMSGSIRFLYTLGVMVMLYF